MVDALVDALGLDGTGRLLDAGLRSLVTGTSDSGWCAEEFPPITLSLWRCHLREVEPRQSR